MFLRQLTSGLLLVTGKQISVVETLIIESVLRFRSVLFEWGAIAPCEPGVCDSHQDQD